MEKTYQTYNDFGVAEAVLEFLTMGDIITESTSARYLIRSSILMESTDEHLPLFESVRFETLSTGGQTHKVAWETYYKVYTNPRDYSDIYAVYQALGFDINQLPSDAQNTMRTNLANLGKRFTDKYGKPDLGAWKNRQKGWAPGGSIRTQFSEEGIDSESEFTEENPQPTIKDVSGGFRNKKTRTVKLFQSINDDNLLPGELYADFTKIPKRNWNSFLKFWNRRKSSVPNDVTAFKEWKKIFLFGYQVQENLFFEVWYNSIDSTFSVHDSRGSEMARRAQTISEAVRKLFNHVLQVSRNDIDYDRSTFNASIANSIAKAAAQGMAGDDRMQDLIRRENDRIKNKQEAERLAVEKQKAKAEQRKAAMQAGVDKMKGAARSGARKAAEFAADRATAHKMHSDWDNNRADAYSGSGRSKSAPEQEAGSDYELSRTKSRDDRVADYELRLKQRRSKKAPLETPDVIELGGKTNSDEKAKKERAKRYKDALEKYEKERKKSISDASMMTSKPAPIKDTRGAEDADEKVVKTKKTKNTPKPKKGSDKKIKSLFTDKDAFDDESDDYSPYRQSMTAAERKELEKEMLGDDDFYDDDDLYDDKISQITGLNESFSKLTLLEQSEIAQDIETAIEDETREVDYQRRVDGIRQSAQTRSYTAGAMKDLIADEVVNVYEKTRAPEKGKLRWLERRFLKGRPDMRILPTDKKPIFNRVKNSLLGGAFRADFIIGYSIADRVDFEVWYVTEPNPEYSWLGAIRGNSNVPKFISSFYVYDITGERLIRKYIPYYRNAVAVISNKIFALV